MKYLVEQFLAHAMPHDLTNVIIWDPDAGNGTVVEALKERNAFAKGTQCCEGLEDTGFTFVDPAKDNPRNYGMDLDWVVTGCPTIDWRAMTEIWFQKTEIRRFVTLAPLESLGHVESYQRALGGAGGPEYIFIHADQYEERSWCWLMFDREKDNYQRCRNLFIPPYKEK